ncbi:unnamed protein product, partial [Phaeothamnion confervicola]
MYFTCASLRSNSVFEHNVADFDGGGIYLAGDFDSVANCTFLRNTATSGSGGAINSEFAETGGHLQACIFASNSAGADGGAI